jgi:hypothetical protein
LGKWISKNTTEGHARQKVHVANSLQKIDSSFNVSFPSVFVVLSFSGVSQRGGGGGGHHKKRFFQKIR